MSRSGFSTQSSTGSLLPSERDLFLSKYSGQRTIVEKTRYEYKGASQYITHRTAAALQGRARLLNREQDLGIPGLRQAKKSYDPLFLLQNYKLVRRT